MQSLNSVYMYSLSGKRIGDDRSTEEDNITDVGETHVCFSLGVGDMNDWVRTLVGGLSHYLARIEKLE